MLIITIVVAVNHNQFDHLAIPLLTTVTLHNGLGLFLGQVIPQLVGFNPQICKTLSI